MAKGRLGRPSARKYAARSVFADLAIHAIFRFPGADEVFMKLSERRYLARGRSMQARASWIVKIVHREDVTPELHAKLFSRHGEND